MLKIGNATFSETHCLIIGEVAQSHDGSLGMARAFVDAIARAGVDAVKFQTHIAVAESTPDEPWRVKFSRQDASRYAYWKRMEFTEQQWAELKRHAEDLGLIFLSSPFSVQAAELLLRLGVAAWKVPSGELANGPMLDRLLATRLPILLSTGMSPLTEIDAVVERIKAAGASLAVLQCTSEYPCPPENVGLHLIPFFRDRYGCAVGLSDHTGTIYAGLAAATLGIEVLEVHVTLSREMFGPDVPVSLTTAELRQLTEGIRFVARMKSASPSKDELARETAPLRNLFTKSVVAQLDLVAGTILREEHLAVKKPGTGIAANRLAEVIGRRLRRNVGRDQMLRLEDLE